MHASDAALLVIARFFWYCSMPLKGGGVLSMTANGWFQIGLYLFVIVLVTNPWRVS